MAYLARLIVLTTAKNLTAVLRIFPKAYCTATYNGVVTSQWTAVASASGSTRPKPAARACGLIGIYPTLERDEEMLIDSAGATPPRFDEAARPPADGHRHLETLLG